MTTFHTNIKNVVWTNKGGLEYQKNDREVKGQPLSEHDK